MALILMSVVGPDHRGRMVLLALGLLGISVSDGFFTYYVTYGILHEQVFLELGWFIGFLVIGLAALSPRQPEPAILYSYPNRLALPFASLAAALISSVVFTLRHGGSDTFLSLLIVLVVILVASRQFVGASDNLGLNRQLDNAVRDLQGRERQLRHFALHDQLTGLANRRLFHDRAERAVAAQGSEGGLLGVFYIDLDGFKQVNDDLGHRTGDHLLIEVAERLLGCMHPSDTIARLGGDEFAVISEGLRTSADAETKADLITRALKESYIINGHAVSIAGSVGVALHYAGASTSVDEMLQRADNAMYGAKLTGTGSYVIGDA